MTIHEAITNKTKYSNTNWDLRKVVIEKQLPPLAENFLILPPGKIPPPPLQ